ncbi:HK97-gp10 family putative phage morphogenesis protein [Natrinema sp. DC36]|uniref:HK97-gp10 family putative phage morphogenesis protein n=1 Tax=Natrinema sp. DC36 TaxID=2878680 RepID=UPI0021025586|nr:HK97-gp10 family putative phage morphogenesis protein [Natrinema sp. DC36]
MISDIEYVKKDLRQNLMSKLEGAMKLLLDTAVAHVADDAYWRGGITASLRSHGVKTEQRVGEMMFSVGTDKKIAPYAPFVEFGTGARSDEKGPTSVLTGKPHEHPPGYPYDSPDVSPSELMGSILEWIKTKPIETDNIWASARKISETIVKLGTYAHPFLRPAWFKHELNLKRAVRSAVKKTFR